MRRRDFLKAATWGAASLTGLPVLGANDAATAKRRPNVVFILAGKQPEIVTQIEDIFSKGRTESEVFPLQKPNAGKKKP